MKLITIIILFLFAGKCLPVLGQNNDYVITGDLEGMDGEVKIVVMNRQNGNVRFDTLETKEGRFSYQGKATQRETLTFIRVSQKERKEMQKKQNGRKGMILSGKFDLTLFVSPGAEIQIRGRQEDFPFLEIRGNEAFNRGMMELQHQNLKELQEINRLHFALNEALWEKDTVTMMDIHEKQKGLREEINRRAEEWIRSHPDQEYALWLYLQSGLTYKTAAELQEQYDCFSPEVQQSALGRELAEMIRVRSALLPGAPAPGFTLKDVRTSAEIRLADYRGKYVLLDFWASWCSPCRKSHPHLIQLARKYKDHSLVLLGIASDREDETIREAAGRDSIDWPQMNIYEKREGQQPLQKMYDVSALPTKVLIDPEGKMVAKYIGNGEEIDGKLEEIFGY